MMKANKFFVDETVSMLLGLLVVVALVVVTFNYFQKRRGSVEVPGVSQTAKEEARQNDNYVVKTDDNLWKIAVKKYGDGYRWVDIWQKNRATVVNPDLISVDQILELPSERVITGDNYKINTGDNLWKIAVEKYGDGYRWVDIWQANKTVIINPDLIYPGMVLVIPMIK